LLLLLLCHNLRGDNRGSDGCQCHWRRQNGPHHIRYNQGHCKQGSVDQNAMRVRVLFGQLNHNIRGQRGKQYNAINDKYDESNSRGHFITVIKN